ncbi:MAG: 7-cyano-7-deazaguanine synthase, partial [Rhizobacter sp.]|nr:7-cyano-7-deazaguanine synthase [Rhizobacter sp.]
MSTGQSGSTNEAGRAERLASPSGLDAPSDRGLKSALVLFSGGQDSTACLVWALARYARVETVGFDYGQRHRIELDCRQEVIKALRAEFPQMTERLGDDHLLDLSLLCEISDTALTEYRAIEMCGNGMRNTFLQGRNM